MFIQHELQVYQVKEEDRRVSSDSPSAQQWHCNWLESRSIPLDSPVIAEVKFHMHVPQVLCKQAVNHTHQVARKDPGATAHNCGYVTNSKYLPKSPISAFTSSY